MKKTIIILLFIAAFITTNAQRVEGIHINLYTDSLKKGTYNYINVDGKMSDGNWKPLTDKELTFSSDYGKFDGNNLIVPDNPSVKKVCVTVALKENPKQTEKVTIWIKQKPDPLLSTDEPDVHRMRRGKR